MEEGIVPRAHRQELPRRFFAQAGHDSGADKGALAGPRKSNDRQQRLGAQSLHRCFDFRIAAEEELSVSFIEREQSAEGTRVTSTSGLFAKRRMQGIGDKGGGRPGGWLLLQTLTHQRTHRIAQLGSAVAWHWRRRVYLKRELGHIALE